MYRCIRNKGQTRTKEGNKKDKKGNETLVHEQEDVKKETEGKELKKGN